jgi:hypothetical protein
VFIVGTSCNLPVANCAICDFSPCRPVKVSSGFGGMYGFLLHVRKLSCCFSRDAFLLRLPADSENGGGMSIRNIGLLPPNFARLCLKLEVLVATAVITF